MFSQKSSLAGHCGIGWFLYYCRGLSLDFLILHVLEQSTQTVCQLSLSCYMTGPPFLIMPFFDFFFDITFLHLIVYCILFSPSINLGWLDTLILQILKYSILCSRVSLAEVYLYLKVGLGRNLSSLKAPCSFLKANLSTCLLLYNSGPILLPTCGVHQVLYTNGVWESI